MRTSYFANWRNFDKEKGVNISNGNINGYEKYKDLVPPYYLVEAYKKGSINEMQFELGYRNAVLNKLDVERVYDDLQDKVLLCYEKSSDFCHRHIISKWIKENLGFEVEEI